MHDRAIALVYLLATDLQFDKGLIWSQAFKMVSKVNRKQQEILYGKIVLEGQLAYIALNY